jgi:hypothetical protein
MGLTKDDRIELELALIKGLTILIVAGDALGDVEE